MFAAFITTTRQFLIHNLSDGHFLIYHRRCIHSTVLSSEFRWIRPHHRFKADQNPWLFDEVCLQLQFSSWSCTEVLQLSNIFQTQRTETHWTWTRLQCDSDLFFRNGFTRFFYSLLDQFGRKWLIERVYQNKRACILSCMLTVISFVFLIRVLINALALLYTSTCLG